MIIVGLGNPGREYEATRHSLGFMVLNELASKIEAPPWKTERRVRVTRATEHFLVTPQGFMNNSGLDLRDWMAWKHLSPAPTELVVIHDDLDFPLGEIHRQVGRSAAGHRGVQSIIDAFGTNNFTRYRLGIGHNRPLDLSAEDYVLQPFAATEKVAVQDLVAAAVSRLADLVANPKKTTGREVTPAGNT